MSTASPSSSIEYASAGRSDAAEEFLGISFSAWLRIALMAALMIALFRFNLWRLWLKTNPVTGEANWGHSMVVPFIGLYYLYIHREELLKARVYTAWTGLPVMLLGVMLFAYGIWPGQNDFLKDFGMVVTLFGVVLLLAGWQVIRIAWFPIAFLVVGIPWPGLVYSWVAGPLQSLAAEVAVKVLQLTGVDAAAYGTKISIARGGGLPARTLNVAEACAGLRSLMTFIAVGGAVAFLSARPLWQKFLVMASAVPIAIFCNVMRVSGQGLLDFYVSQELSEGFAHAFVGMIMLIPAFFLILLIGWCLDKIFIDEVENKAALARASTKLVVTPFKPTQAMPATVSPISSAIRNAARKVNRRPVTQAGAVLPPLSPRAQAAARRVRPAGDSSGAELGSDTQ